MRTIVLDYDVLAAARKAFRANGNKVLASNCLIATAATKSLGETVKDCGSFYVDTDKGAYEFVGGYNAPAATSLREIMDLFRSDRDDELKHRLPIIITLKN